MPSVGSLTEPFYNKTYNVPGSTIVDESSTTLYQFLEELERTRFDNKNTNDYYDTFVASINAPRSEYQFRDSLRNLDSVKVVIDGSASTVPITGSVQSASVLNDVWTLTIGNVANVSLVAVDDIVVKDDFVYYGILSGCWKITSVDTQNSTITVEKYSKRDLSGVTGYTFNATVYPVVYRFSSNWAYIENCYMEFSNILFRAGTTFTKLLTYGSKLKFTNCVFDNITLTCHDTFIYDSGFMAFTQYGVEFYDCRVYKNNYTDIISSHYSENNTNFITAVNSHFNYLRVLSDSFGNGIDAVSSSFNLSRFYIYNNTNGLKLSSSSVIDGYIFAGGNQTDIYAENNSMVKIPMSGVTTTSPAIGVVGNREALITT